MAETLPTLPGIFLPWKKLANARKQPGYERRNPVDIVDNSSGVCENPVDKIADIFGYSENAVDVVDSISEVWEGIFDIVERISGVCESPVDVVDGIFECAAASSTLSTTFPPRMPLSGGIKKSAVGTYANRRFLCFRLYPLVWNTGCKLFINRQP